MFYPWGGWCRGRGEEIVFGLKYSVLYYFVFVIESYLKSRSSTLDSQKKFDIHLCVSRAVIISNQIQSNI